MYKTIDGVVSLSVFGGNFVLAKVRLGPIGIRCSELRGVRFSEVRNVLLVLWYINRGQVIFPLLRGCPAFWRVPFIEVLLYTCWAKYKWFIKQYKNSTAFQNRICTNLQ